VRLAYRADEVRLSVADDGTGDPEVLRRALRAAGRPGGYHRGLGNMASRCREAGATLRFARARMGGVRVEVRLPLAPEVAGG
jgi:signal transduction histidine kinase